jgi:hypothetical protein
MDKEARERLIRALELVHNAKAELLENVGTLEDPDDEKRHYERAWGMLVDAVGVVGLLAGIDLPPSWGAAK